MTAVSYGAPTITLAASLLVVEECIAAANSAGKPMSVAVVDSSGLLKAAVNMDGAPLLAEAVARQKAWSAASWKMPTMDWIKFIGDDPILQQGVPRIPGLTVLGGGLPLCVDGSLVGAVGVSGGHYSEDDEIARAGVTAFEQRARTTAT